jgi:hypothetical protein
MAYISFSLAEEFKEMVNDIFDSANIQGDDDMDDIVFELERIIDHAAFDYEKEHDLIE